MIKLLHNRGMLFLLLAATVFVLYSFMLQCSFKTLDDEGSIVRNVWIKDFQFADEILKSSYFGTNDYYRPLVLLSYMLEHRFFALDAFGYYLTNIFIHIAVCFFVFQIFLRILRPQSLAFAATALYAIHPVHWEAVSNISGRAILLCALFTISAFWFFLERTKRPWFYVLALFSFALGLLCKESAGVFPLLILSYQFFLGRDRRQKLRQWLIPVVPFFLLLVPYVVLRQSLGITELFYPRNFGEMLLGFLTFLRSTVTFVRMFFLPADLHFDRSLPFLAGWFNLDMLLITAFYGATAYLLFRYRHRISRTVWFLLSWPVIDLAPVSQVLVSIGIQPGHISTAEHFIYAASAAFAALVVLGAYKFYQWNKQRRIISKRWLLAGFVFFYGYLMVTLVENNIYSSNEIAMLERTVRHDPWNGRIHLSLALAYAKDRRFKDAEQAFRKALNIDPLMNVRAQIGLGKSLCDQGKYWEGLEAYDTIPDPMKLGELLEDNRNLTVALLRKRYEALSAEDKNNADYFYALGILRHRSGETAQSLRDLERSVGLKPDFREAWFNLAAGYALAGKWQPAINAYKKVLQLSCKDDLLLFKTNMFLAKICKSTNDLASAERYEKEAARILAVIEK